LGASDRPQSHSVRFHSYVLERGTVVHQGPAAALHENLDLRRQVLWM
jgi:ABC-type branched-subunit amino acid transport system ATPase component